MSAEVSPDALVKTLDEALDMLRDYSRDIGEARAASEPLPSLLAQCESAVGAMAGPQPIRSIHHFACTGGTLMCKALFALPNAVVLSEIDPLSKMMLTESGKVPFAPTDLIYALRHSIRPVDENVLAESFLAALEAVKNRLERDGRYLILRDHAHSQFCWEDVDFDSRPTLHEMLADHFDTRSIVTIRHPLDSYLSLITNKWVHFTPATLEEYARRYLAFLDRHDGLPIVLYEDFTVNPDIVLRQMCDYLGLKYSTLATGLLSVVRMSGDSGRNEGPIGPRPRREVPEEIEAQRGNSPSYRALCARFDYSP